MCSVLALFLHFFSTGEKQKQLFSNMPPGVEGACDIKHHLPWQTCLS
jgi:hypothetical protein